MSQRQYNAPRDESGINVLNVLDTPEERSSAGRRSLGNNSSSWPRVESAEPRPSQTAELLPEGRPSQGVSLLSGVARDSGVRLSNAGPAPNNYKMMSWVLPIVWFSVGFGNCIPGPSFQNWQVYSFNINPAEQTLLGGVICSLPWNLKIFVAFISDVAPICGHRRLPYLVLGLILKGSAWFFLGVYGKHFTFPLLALMQFCATLGQMMTGVMCDTLIVENVKYEVQEGKDIGRLQTNSWMMLSIGGLLGGLVSGWLPQYLHISYLNMFIIDGIFHFVLLAFCLFLVKDPKFERTGRLAQSLRTTWGDMWSTMSLVRVLKPLIFIIAFAMVPGSGSAFNTYLVQARELCHFHTSNMTCTSPIFNEEGTVDQGYMEYCNQYAYDADACNTRWGGLGFSTSLYAYMGILGSVGSVIGSVVFKKFFINANWHRLFASVVTIAAASSSLQIVLCFRNQETGKTANEQAHIPDSLFALGDDVVMAAANQLLSMPILILMSRLCPEGAEGTVYALVTSIQMVGGTVSGIISKICINAFGVTNIAFGHLWQLVLITSLAKMIAVFLLPLVPKDLDDNTSNTRHWLCGAFLLACFLGGLSWAFVQIIQSLLTL